MDVAGSRVARRTTRERARTRKPGGPVSPAMVVPTLTLPLVRARDHREQRVRSPPNGARGGPLLPTARARVSLDAVRPQSAHRCRRSGTRVARSVLDDLRLRTRAAARPHKRSIRK